MQKLTRTKILIERIEAQIEKNQRRIQDISEQNFELRKSLEGLKELPKGETLTKAQLEARDKTNRIGKFYDAAFHEEQRQKAREAAEAAKKAAEEAVKATEVVTDNADQEIGMTPTEAQ